MLQALGSTWHEACFKCAGCGETLTASMTFAEQDGEPYHVECLTKKRATVCRTCAQPIMGEYVKAGQDAYHEACFVCATCKGSLEGGYLLRSG